MKKLAILLTALTLGTAGAYAREASFEELLDGGSIIRVKAVELPSQKISFPVPEGMETCKFAEAKGDTCVFSCPSGAAVSRPRLNSSVAQNGGCALFVMVPKPGSAQKAAPAAAETVLEITSREKITLRATATYMAKNEVMGCTHMSFSDGHLQSLPLVFDREIPVTANPNGGTITFSPKLPGKCASTLVGFSLRVANPKIGDSLNDIGLQFSQTDQNAVQKMVFKRIVSPWTGESWVISGQSILVGPNGKAKAEIVLE